MLYIISAYLCLAVLWWIGVFIFLTLIWKYTSVVLYKYIQIYRNQSLKIKFMQQRNPCKVNPAAALNKCAIICCWHLIMLLLATNIPNRSTPLNKLDQMYMSWAGLDEHKFISAIGFVEFYFLFFINHSIATVAVSEVGYYWTNTALAWRSQVTVSGVFCFYENYYTFQLQSSAVQLFELPPHLLLLAKFF